MSNPRGLNTKSNQNFYPIKYLQKKSFKIQRNKFKREKNKKKKTENKISVPENIL